MHQSKALTFTHFESTRALELISSSRQSEAHLDVLYAGRESQGLVAAVAGILLWYTRVLGVYGSIGKSRECEVGCHPKYPG